MKVLSLTSILRNSLFSSGSRIGYVVFEYADGIKRRIRVRRSFRFGALFLALFLVLGSPVWPGEKNSEALLERLRRIESLELVPFEISGSTLEELREDIRAKGPRDLYGTRRDAAVEWQISWHWPEDSSGKANLSEAVVSRRIKLR